MGKIEAIIPSDGKKIKFKNWEQIHKVQAEHLKEAFKNMPQPKKVNGKELETINVKKILENQDVDKELKKLQQNLQKIIEEEG